MLIGRGDGRFVRTDITTGSLLNPRGICAADLNADGKPDLVYSAYGSDAVQVLLGNGTGGFAPGPKSVGFAAKPQGVEAADFNHDGYMDVAVASDSARGLAILYGNGGAALTAKAIPGAEDLNVLALADLNRDGWIDVVAASTARSIVAIYTGSASGLVFRKFYPVDPGPRSVAVADLNSDGVPDAIVVSRQASAAAVLPGDPLGDGAFLPALPFAAGQGSRAVAAADLDGDGLRDIVTGNQYARSVTVLSNQTNLVRAGFAFDEMAMPVAASLVSDSRLAAADFNRDGRLDVVARGGSRPGDGEGVVVALSGHADVLLPGPHPFEGFVVADFTTDGNPDVLYIAGGSANLGGGIHTLLVPYLGNGRGAFTAAPQTGSPLSLRKCVAGDLNRDARADLVCIGYDDTTGAQILNVLAGRGDGTFRSGTNLVLSEGATDVQLADVNRDGALDVVVLQSNAEIRLGDGTGALSRGGGADLAGVFYPRYLRVADLNRDARADLIVTANNGELIVSLANATGFGPASVVWSGALGEVEIADIDGDGRADIVATWNSGLVFRGAGDGTFAPPEGFAFGGPVAVADVTGDGLLDIVAHGAAGFRVLVNRRTEVNRPPIVTAPDRTLEFYEVIPDPMGDFDCPFLHAEATDPDQHAVSFEWRDSAGALVSTEGDVRICEKAAGQYPRQLTVRDGRGGVVTRTATLTIRPGKEIVVYAVNLTGDDDVWQTGTWTQVADSAGAGGFRAFDPNRGAPKTTAPVSNPVSAVRIRFTPDPTQVYKLWVRLKAEGNYWGNDSVWLQFSGATNATGTPVYRIGTTSGLAINLEECSGCGVSGWGWEDDGWGAVGRNGGTLRFPGGGRQDILIQTREDGVSVDQVVLSAEKYLTTRPGLAKNDRTILPRTYQVNPH